jgi:opacity protein-like surface antigen
MNTTPLMCKVLLSEEFFMKKLLVMVLFSVVGLMTSLITMAAAMPTVQADNLWSVTLGTGYAFVKGYGASGDMMATGVDASDHSYIDNSNLEFQGAWTGNFMIARDLGHYFTLGLSYEYLQSNVAPGSIASGEGDDLDGTYGSYKGDLTINTFMLRGRLNWWHAFSMGVLSTTTPFVGVGIGTANLNLHNQTVLLQTGNINFTPKNNSVWRLAYSAEIGMVTAFNKAWLIDYGVRYTNYGKMNSGTKLADYPAPMKNAVESYIYSIAPFVDIVFHF